MQRVLTQINIENYPESLRPLLAGADIYDSRCASGAEVLFIDRDCGYFLKSMKRGELEAEARMAKYFGSLGLGAKVLSFEQTDRDYMLTERVRGEDCTDRRYLSDPKRLCELYAELLYDLHQRDFTDCPVQNRIESYSALAFENYRTGNYDKDSFPDSFGYASAEEAMEVIKKYGSALKNDTLIHGDYCLPNVMLDDWKFSAFIDVGNGGVGDRHIDLFWGAWTLWYNLKTNEYEDRFLDAYGRQNFDRDMLRVVAAFEVFG
ncbi:MAG: aminoglycoside 3'-phosphotransferase [Clostridia bacterium]|nr:aminoglycoside 3'-phosphotransferase [Clostridia bacterium]